MDKKSKSKRQDYNITGISGEFFVAAELSRRGLIATMTLKNTPLVDVIATNDKGKVASIQVKARSEKNKQGWMLGAKSSVDQKLVIIILCLFIFMIKNIYQNIILFPITFLQITLVRTIKNG